MEIVLNVFTFYKVSVNSWQNFRITVPEDMIMSASEYDKTNLVQTNYAKLEKKNNNNIPPNNIIHHATTFRFFFYTLYCILMFTFSDELSTIFFGGGGVSNFVCFNSNIIIDLY